MSREFDEKVSFIITVISSSRSDDGKLKNYQRFDFSFSHCANSHKCISIIQQEDTRTLKLTHERHGKNTDKI